MLISVTFGRFIQIHLKALYVFFIAEEAKQHAESIRDLKKRWENIQRKLLDIRNTTKLFEDKEKFHNDVEALQRELADIDGWCGKQQAERATHNLLIHVRNRLRALRALGGRLQDLGDQRLAADHERLLQLLTARETEIKQAISKTPPETTDDDFKTLQNKIQEMESQTILEHAMVSPPDDMRARLQRLESLRQELQQLQGTYERVVNERRQAHRGSVQELNFKSSLENLVTKFGDTHTILQQKIDKLQNGEGCSCSVCACVCVRSV